MHVHSDQLFEVLEATWPAASVTQFGPWKIRAGAGGGQRVSAATLCAKADPGAIKLAEDAMRGLGQNPIFMIRAEDEALDQWLHERGYDCADACNLYCIRSAELAGCSIPPVTVFDVWEPLAIVEEIWAEAGIGQARLAVMQRAKGPKTALLGRILDRPGGAAFVAGHEAVAMVHALEIRPDQRRHGLGKYMMLHAAKWAMAQGFDWLSVICTKDNHGANALYRSLGMQIVAHYHYRRAPKE